MPSPLDSIFGPPAPTAPTAHPLDSVFGPPAPTQAQNPLDSLFGDFNAQRRRTTGLPGDQAPVEPTPMQANISAGINFAGRGLAMLPELGAQAVGATWDVLSAKPLRDIFSEVSGKKPSPPAMQSFAEPITDLATKGIDWAKEKAGIGPNVNTPLDPVAGFLGQMVVPGAVGKLAKVAMAGRAGEAATAAERAAPAIEAAVPEGTAPLRRFAGSEGGSVSEITPVAGSRVAPETQQAIGADMAAGRAAATEAPGQTMNRGQRLWRATITPVIDGLKKTGPTGREVAAKIETTVRDAEQMAGKVVHVARKIKPLSAQDKTIVEAIADGRINPQSLPPGKAHLAGLADEWHQARLPIGQTAEEFGVKTWEEGALRDFHMRNDYVPLIFKEGSPTAQEMDRLRRSASGLTAGGTKSSNLMRARTIEDLTPAQRADLLPLDQRISVYAERAARQAAEAKHFGIDGTNFESVVNDIRKAADVAGDTDPAYLEAGFRKAMGQTVQGDKDMNWIASNLMAYQGASKLTTMAIPNATQTINTLKLAGWKNTAAAVRELTAKATKAGAKQFADESGAVIEGAMREVLHGTEDTVMGKIASWEFNHSGASFTEKWNRMIAAQAGDKWAQALVEQVAKGGEPARKAAETLRWLGASDESIARGVLTEQDRLNAAWKVSRETQFGMGPESIPLSWNNTALSRLLLQFKQFGLKQAIFDTERVVKPAATFIRSGGKNGSLKPLLTLLSVGPLAGEAVRDLRGFIGGYDPHKGEGGLERYLTNIAAVGAMGILADTLQSVTKGPVTRLGETVIGPTASDVVGGTVAGVSAARTGKVKPIDRYLQRSNKPYNLLRDVGSAISNAGGGW